MKDKQAIQKMAEEYAINAGGVKYGAIYQSHIDGYTAAVEDMEKEAVGFAEWLHKEYYYHPDGWHKGGLHHWKTANLLTLYRESIKTPQTKD